MSGNVHNANFIECPDSINPRVSNSTEAVKPVPVPEIVHVSDSPPQGNHGVEVRQLRAIPAGVEAEYSLESLPLPSFIS
jgi:hypothetical protein